MNKVCILDDVTANQIAAGEVVERPVSVVKELIENSLDAASDEITVLIANGGRTAIEVIDNGHGMTRQDALLAIERFGTSKIRHVSDLQSVGTLGFRGEALPSIAAVSKFRLRTSPKQGDGADVAIHGGKLISAETCSGVSGTRVSVDSLFYNVPARKKFLKTERTEAGLIRALVLDFAASYPSVRFKLALDGRDSLILPAEADFFKRLDSLELISKSAIRVDSSISDILVQGLLSEPSEAVPNSNKLRLIVNGRSVRDRVLLRAARDGYGGMLKPQYYPQGILLVNLAADQVDVNVHPQKAEVRFRESQKVYQAVYAAVNEALAQARPAIVSSFSSQRGFGPGEGAWNESFEVAEFKPSVMGSQTQFFDQTIGNKKTSSLRFVGQIFSCYLLFESQSEFRIVDMHAAHERVTHFKLWTQYATDGSIASQGLLLPTSVDLPLELEEAFEVLSPELEKLGFEIDRIDKHALAIRSIPALLAGSDVSRMFLDMLSAPEMMGSKQVLMERLEAVIARMACHGSIRLGREVEREEAYALVEALEEASASAFCPHGRPVEVSFSIGELERLFGRVK